MSVFWVEMAKAKKGWLAYYERTEKAPERELNSRPPKLSYTGPFGALPLSYRAAYSNKFVGNLVVVALSLSVFFFKHGNYWSYHWYSKWALLLTLFAFLIALHVARMTSWLLLPVLLYSFWSASRVALWSNHIYTDIADPIARLALEKNCIYALLVLIVTGLALSAFRKGWSPGARLSLGIICTVSAVHTALLPLHGGVSSGLYSGNPSMNGCLIAATLPFVMYAVIRASIYWGMNSQEALGVSTVPWFIALFAIYRTDGSAPFLVLGVGTAALLWRLYGQRTIKWTGALALLLVTVGELTVQHQPFFHDSGRLYIWKLMFHWWHDHTSLYTGMGLGTIQIVTPIAQVMDDPHTVNYFLWLHNEWLQMLVEMGYVGLTTVLVAWAYLMKKAYASPDLFAGLCAFTAMGFVNYPLRLPIHALCLTLICAMAIRSGDRESGSQDSETLSPFHSCT